MVAGNVVRERAGTVVNRARGLQSSLRQFHALDSQ